MHFGAHGIVFQRLLSWKQSFQMHMQHYSPGGLQKPVGISTGNIIKVFHCCTVAETPCQYVLSPKLSHMPKYSAALLSCQELQLLI